jgi:hypothetical protein
VDLGETLPLVCSERGLAHSADGIEVCDMKVEKILTKPDEEDPLTLALPAIKPENEVCIG